jgi:signal transduction histidine kinase
MRRFSAGPKSSNLWNPARNGWMWLRQSLAAECHSLRGRLLYTLIGLLVILLAFEAQEHFFRLSSRREVLRAGHARAAATTAAAFRTSLNQIYRLQQIIARTTLMGRMSPDQNNPYLLDVRDQYPGMVSVSVIAPDNGVKYGAPTPGGRISVADEAFRQALTPRTPFYFSNLYATPGGERFRVASMALDPQGEMLGIVSMEFSPAALPGLLGAGDAGAILLLLDGNGQLAFSTQGPQTEALVENNPTIRKALARQGDVPVDLELVRGEDLLGYSVQVPDMDWKPDMGWKVVYLRPERESLGGLNQDARLKLMLMFLVVVALGTAILVLLRVSLRPVVRLSAAAHKLGSGDLAFRLPPAEVQEFESLVEAFNRMAERLEAAQLQLENANVHLEEEVRRATEELREEHEKLIRAERLSTLGLLSSAIAHDLRSPLNTIGLAAQWLKIRLADGGDERVQARMETIQRELRRSDQIIKTLLAFARTGEPNREALDLNALVAEVASVMQPHSGVSIELDLAPGESLPPVSADAAQLFQVLENLIRNAVQAMPEGGSVRVSTQADTDVCRIRVSDTGPGIPEEMQESVFEPLVTTKTTGTGLGLALCKRIIDAHGGRISVESRPGEGATFEVELPLGN